MPFCFLLFVQVLSSHKTYRAKTFLLLGDNQRPSTVIYKSTRGRWLKLPMPDAPCLNATYPDTLPLSIPTLRYFPSAVMTARGFWIKLLSRPKPMLDNEKSSKHFHSTKGLQRGKHLNRRSRFSKHGVFILLTYPWGSSGNHRATQLILTEIIIVLPPPIHLCVMRVNPQNNIRLVGRYLPTARIS